MIRKYSAAAAIAAIFLISSLASAGDDPYEQDFSLRADWFIAQTAKIDPVAIMDWSHKISLGDPHKYAMPAILARLWLDPADEKALDAYRDLMEVDKSKGKEIGKGDRGLYNFALFPKTRMYFLLGDKLPADFREALEYDITNWPHMLCSGGTDNHTWMSRAAGNLWLDKLPGVADKIVKRADATTSVREYVEGWMKREVSKLYTVGQGEYDSSTYIAFSAASLTNLYDYTDVPEKRLLAKAALDWMSAAVALKYFHGVSIGPESRGFAQEAVATTEVKPTFPGTAALERTSVGAHTDWLAWLWWGGSASRVIGDNAQVERSAVIVPALSSYRPHEVVRNIALKKVPLPFEARGSKPTYYGYKGNLNQEYLFIGSDTAMSTLYTAQDGTVTKGSILPQTTAFKICLLDGAGVRVFGAANGYHGHFPLEGLSPYDQYHQKRDAAIDLCHVFAENEDGRTKFRSIFGAPTEAGEPVVRDGWWFWQVNKAYLAVRPLNGVAAFASVTKPDSDEEVKGNYHWLVSPGKTGGWAIQLGQQDEYPSLDSFQKAVLDKCKLDVSRLEGDREAEFTSLRGDVIKIRHSGQADAYPECWTNGEKVDFVDWPVYESPYVNQALGSGILKLSDGAKTITIDCSGDQPVWTEGNVGK